MTGFVNRINIADQSIDRNKKLPANLVGKSRCDTVESVKAKLSDAMVMRCLLDGCETRAKLVKEGIERSVNSNCRLCCCPLKIKFGKFNQFHSKPFQGLSA